MHLDLQAIKDKACFAVSILDIAPFKMLEASPPYSEWFALRILNIHFYWFSYQGFCINIAIVKQETDCWESPGNQGKILCNNTVLFTFLKGFESNLQTLITCYGKLLKLDLCEH